MMHEETGVCPYVDRCGDVRALRRVEDRMIRERRDYFSRYGEVDHGEYGEAMDDYRRRLEGLGRASRVNMEAPLGASSQLRTR